MQAVSDILTAYFAEELIAAYPNAKIILNTCDPQEWHKSIMNALCQSYIDSWMRGCALILGPSPLGVLVRRFAELCLAGDSFPESGMEALEDHNNRVRNLAPPERFLEYDVKQGWGPLCRFLGKGCA
jgi:hypothetical protein